MPAGAGPQDCRWYDSPAAGLRALADLVNDALVAMGTQPAFAGPIVMAGFAYDSPDHQWTADNAALLVLGRLAQAALAHFLPAQAADKAAK